MNILFNILSIIFWLDKNNKQKFPHNNLEQLQTRMIFRIK